MSKQERYHKMTEQRDFYVIAVPPGRAFVDVPCMGPRDREPQMRRLCFVDGVLMLDSFPGRTPKPARALKPGNAPAPEPPSVPPPKPPSVPPPRPPTCPPPKPRKYGLKKSPSATALKEDLEAYLPAGLLD